MSKVDEDWKRAVLKRFDGRKNLDTDELYRRYFEQAGFPRDEVFECLRLLEVEYEVPAGVLRPTDKLEKLFSPVEAKTPWQWLVFRTREGDSETEINYELGKRLRRYGTLQSWSQVERFGDLTIAGLLRAWCGFEPMDNDVHPPS